LLANISYGLKESLLFKRHLRVYINVLPQAYVYFANNYLNISMKGGACRRYMHISFTIMVNDDEEADLEEEEVSIFNLFEQDLEEDDDDDDEENNLYYSSAA
jgi:hypothetical protein